MPNFPPIYQPLITALTALPTGTAPAIVAIDGRCGSGKTVLAHQLAEHFGCNLIHIDDFYLPFAQRTAERMSTPGGHIHWARLREEVLLPLSLGQPATLRVYDCHRDTFAPAVSLPSQPLTIVEGSYSHQPTLRDCYQRTVFLTCDGQRQQQRLLNREGAEKFAQFQQRWIPMEERYLNHFKIEQQCDINIDTTSVF